MSATQYSLRRSHASLIVVRVFQSPSVLIPYLKEKSYAQVNKIEHYMLYRRYMDDIPFWLVIHLESFLAYVNSRPFDVPMRWSGSSAQGADRHWRIVLSLLVADAVVLWRIQHLPPTLENSTSPVVNSLIPAGLLPYLRYELQQHNEHSLPTPLTRRCERGERSKPLYEHTPSYVKG